jgi:uncharacterized protein YecE (DUF72 family)
MKCFVGTSGWAYPVWNPTQRFTWYAENSGLNVVELNASFYRFPFPSMVKGWSKTGGAFRWSIKVNRLITHVFQFTPRALATWKKFRKLFKPLDGSIDFYLFQLPPNSTRRAMPKLERFIKAAKLGERFALEARNRDWFHEDAIAWAEKLGITFVSVDAPDLPREVYNTSGMVYERVHGRTAWYAHHYSPGELREIAAKIKAAKPKRAYVFFNNDHGMLENARSMLKVLKR